MVQTPRGPARVQVLSPDDGVRGLVMLGHGAGGGVQAPDLRTATSVALLAGWAVALVEQPYRVAERRAPAPAGHLDEAWIAVAEHLLGREELDRPGGDRAAGAGPDGVGAGAAVPGAVVSGEAALHGAFAGLPLVVGGRSSGARVACRTAADLGAAGVLCLAFPLQPPKDRPTRLPELDAVTVPTLVVQGERDPFGMPPPAPGRTIAVVRGDHGLKPDQDAIAAAVGDWLTALAGKP